MSNAVKPKGKAASYTADRYRSLGAGEPFQLLREDGTVLEIPRPDTDIMFECEELQRLGLGGPRDLLRKLCGSVGDEVVEMVRSWPIEGTNAFTEDLMEFFGMGE